MTGSVQRIALACTASLLFAWVHCGCERAKPARTVVVPSSVAVASRVALPRRPSETADSAVAHSLAETASAEPLASPRLSPTSTFAPSAEPTSSPTAAAPEPTLTPTVPVPTPATSPGHEITYTVRPGDTVLAIAANHQTTVKAIVDRNGLADRHTIRVGQVLIIPVAYEPTETPESGATVAQGTAPAARTHKVKPGESLSIIAAQYGVSTQSLVRANNLADPSLIRVGQVLVIPEE